MALERKIVVRIWLLIAAASFGFSCHQPCEPPAPGVFQYGINYAWRVYGGDFGGIARWKQKGVAATYSTHLNNFKRIKRETGARVVRWWLWPDLRGDGIRFEGHVVRPGQTLFDDVEAALRIAEATDIDLVLCLFSFEAFAPEHQNGGIRVRNLEDVLRNSESRATLLKNVIEPLARFVQRHPLRHRVFAYDLINEPEWSIKGRNRYGDPGYTPLESVRPVSHEFMEKFLIDLANAVRNANGPLLTIGQVSPAWPRAWSRLQLDFYQWHLYDWMKQKEIYQKRPSDLGICDRPVIIGELPLAGLVPGQSHADVVTDLYRNGYAGAWTWSFQGRVPKGARLSEMGEASAALHKQGVPAR